MSTNINVYYIQFIYFYKLLIGICSQRNLSTVEHEMMLNMDVIIMQPRHCQSPVYIVGVRHTWCANPCLCHGCLPVLGFM